MPFAPPAVPGIAAGAGAGVPAASHAGADIRVQHDEEFARVVHGAPPRSRPHPPEDKRRGMREFAMIDPDGALLRFGARIG